MFIFNRSQEIRENRLYIPYHMRAVLGLHNERLLHITASRNPADQYRNNFLISAVPYDKRKDMWNLRASFTDRPGLLYELTSLLRHYQIDILDCSVVTRDQNGEFAIDLDFDAKSYESRFDLTTEERIRQGIWPQELSSRIVHRFLDDLIIKPDGKPKLYFTKNHLLAGSVTGDHTKHQDSLKNGYVQLPPDLLRNLRQQFVNDFPDANLDDEGVNPRAAVAADPGFRNLAVCIYFPNSGYIHARIDCKNQIGTLASLTRGIVENKFNIIQFYTRDLDGGSMCRADVFMHFTRVHQDGLMTDAQLQDIVRKQVFPESLDALSCSVSFPELLSPEEISNDSILSIKRRNDE